jgi:hypothetical protein
MTAQTDWVAVEGDYRETRKSIREIGRQHGVPEASIRKRAKAEGWTRPDMKKVRAAHKEVRAAANVLATTTSSDPEDLVTRGRDIVGRLMDELSSVTANYGEIEEMILAETEGDENDKRRDAMLKAVSLSSRAGVARNLATAFKTLQESGAGGKKGKKEQQAEAAQEIASAGRFAPRRTPKLVVDNG